MKRGVLWVFALAAVLTLSMVASGTGKPAKKQSKMRSPSLVKSIQERDFYNLLGGGGPDSFGYVWTDTIPFNWVEISGVGTPLMLCDDDNTGLSLVLPSSFYFYGTMYDTLAACSNGWVSFTDGSSTFYDGIITLPDTAFPDAYAFPFLIDLDPSVGGEAYFYADAANNRAIVEWSGVPFYDTLITNTFQVILDGSDSSIVFQYLSSLDWFAVLNYTPVIGIQNDGATIGLQADQDSVVNGYAIKFYKVITDDVSPITIDAPGPVIGADSTLAPQATVRNVGFNIQSFDVTCEIELSGVPVYADTQFVDSLTTGSDAQVNFAPFNFSGTGNVYDIKVTTLLAGDLNNSNDTLMSQTITFDFSPVIISPYTPTPPTIDGIIDSTEWANATLRDVSDVLGQTGAANLLGSALLYVMNDANNLYIALDGMLDLTQENLDKLALYFDDNHNHIFTFPPDTSEGTLWLDWFGVGGVVRYRWIRQGPNFGIPYLTGSPGAVSIGSGHQQFEIVVPFSSIAEDLNANPGDTVGFFLSTNDAAVSEVYGWWPSVVDSVSGWYTASEYGDLILSTPPVGVEEPITQPSVPRIFTLHQNIPNPFSASGGTQIRYQLPEPVQVSLRIYDVSGKLVRTLVNGSEKSGFKSRDWDGRDEKGSEVSTGVYFLRLKAGEDYTQSKKMVLLH
ncbi:T9SS type A sorting domain-containing protein [candidate division TA06 bacterium]|nr:T9SS type A sorting domain-containing protein [candidate division TA06 bacterium]